MASDLGRRLRDAVIEETVNDLPVAMVLSDFGDLVKATPSELDQWVTEGRVQPLAVGNAAYVFPALNRELMTERGMLHVPVDPARVDAMLHGTTPFQLSISEDALALMWLRAPAARLRLRDSSVQTLEEAAFENHSATQSRRRRPLFRGARGSS